MGVCKCAGRVTVIHKNIPNMLSQLTSACAQAGININDMTNKSRNAFAYTMMDLDNSASDEVLEKLKELGLSLNNSEEAAQ